MGTCALWGDGEALSGLPDPPPAQDESAWLTEAPLAESMPEQEIRGQVVIFLPYRVSVEPRPCDWTAVAIWGQRASPFWPPIPPALPRRKCVAQTNPCRGWL